MFGRLNGFAGCLIAATLMLVSVHPLQAHFIWIARSAETGEMQIFFGEAPVPGSAALLDNIEGMNVKTRNRDFNHADVGFVKRTDGENGWYTCVSDVPLTQVECECEYGVITRNEKSFMLRYCAKYMNHKNGTARISYNLIPLDILVNSSSGALQLCVIHKAQPVAGCEVVIVEPDGTTHNLETDADGCLTPEIADSGRFLIRAKVVEQESGEHDGQGYESVSNYCTLTLDRYSDSDETATVAAMELPDMPVGITSFGGALAGNHIYVYGGHCGNAHEYYAEGQNQTLYSLDLNEPQQWNAVGEGIGLQGLAMISYDGNLYRLGGFNARNEEGDDQDLHSVNEFAVFDHDSKNWRQLTPMPTARSSFDAVVVNNTVYVVGGWVMEGAKEQVWCDTALSFDLSDESAQWEQLPDVPFRRRAISLGYQGEQLFVIGGMEPGGTTRQVAIFNLNSREWSEGPELPGEESMEGFGSSCFNIGGTLVASTYGGNVYRLNEAGDNWELITKMETGRFFHRLLPVSDSAFALFGGANMRTGKTMQVPVFNLER
ncbi:MAG: hypothetical protein AAF456_14855 [Planctomycetota bacterium]